MLVCSLNKIIKWNAWFEIVHENKAGVGEFWQKHKTILSKVSLSI